MYSMKILCALLGLLLLPTVMRAADPGEGAGPFRIISREILSDRKPYMERAYYPEPTGDRIMGRGFVSDDNGKTWVKFHTTPDYQAKVPAGFRRGIPTGVVDPRNGLLFLPSNALDTPKLDPTIQEPPIAMSEYYLRYRVSKDGGRTWLFDEPVIHTGYSEMNPFKGMYRGKNAMLTSDTGNNPIITHTGRVVLPVMMTVLGDDGTLSNPAKTTSYTDVAILLGTWKDEYRIAWREASQRLRLTPDVSTRGLIEPTLVQLNDQRLLMILRGSNARNPSLPSYKWMSVSSDDGDTWSQPQPWRYDDGRPFFSPSSMSFLLKHSSGRVFWVGNIHPENCNGNDPRTTLVIGEVDVNSLLLQRASVFAFDAKQPADDARGQALLGTFDGKLDLSHVWVLEDRRTSELVITYQRAYGGYKKTDFTMVRMAVAPPSR